jgi:hypothetical protein
MTFVFATCSKSNFERQHEDAVRENPSGVELEIRTRGGREQFAASEQVQFEEIYTSQSSGLWHIKILDGWNEAADSEIVYITADDRCSNSRPLTVRILQAFCISGIATPSFMSATRIPVLILKFFQASKNELPHLHLPGLPLLVPPDLQDMGRDVEPRRTPNDYFRRVAFQGRVDEGNRVTPMISTGISFLQGIPDRLEAGAVLGLPPRCTMKISSPKAVISVGAVIVTPQPGGVTQEIFIDEAAKGKRYADHYLKDLRKRANEMAEEGTETVGRPKKAVASEGQATKDAYMRESPTGTS